jgi:hypothetical protein
MPVVIQQFAFVLGVTCIIGKQDSEIIKNVFKKE